MATHHHHARPAAHPLRARVEPSAGAHPVRNVVPHRHHHAHRTARLELGSIRANVAPDTSAVTGNAAPADPRIDSGVTGGAVAPDEPDTPDPGAGAQTGNGAGTSPAQAPGSALSAVQPPPPGPNSGSGSSSGSSSGQGTQPATSGDGGSGKGTERSPRN